MIAWGSALAAAAMLSLLVLGHLVADAPATDHPMTVRIAWPREYARPGGPLAWAAALPDRATAPSGRPLVLRRIAAAVPDSYAFETLTQRIRSDAHGVVHWITSVTS